MPELDHFDAYDFFFTRRLPISHKLSKFLKCDNLVMDRFNSS